MTPLTYHFIQFLYFAKFRVLQILGCLALQVDGSATLRLCASQVDGTLTSLSPPWAGSFPHSPLPSPSFPSRGPCRPSCPARALSLSLFPFSLAQQPGPRALSPPLSLFSPTPRARTSASSSPFSFPFPVSLRQPAARPLPMAQPRRASGPSFPSRTPDPSPAWTLLEARPRSDVGELQEPAGGAGSVAGRPACQGRPTPFLSRGSSFALPLSRHCLSQLTPCPCATAPPLDPRAMPPAIEPLRRRNSTPAPRILHR
jgi:hypothetical protein